MGHVIRRGAAVIVVALLATFVGGSPGEPGQIRSSAPAVSDSAGTVGVSSVLAKRAGPVLRLDFDRGRQRSGGELRSFRSYGTASVRVRSVTSNGGAVVRRPGHREGWAVRLPAYSASDPAYAVVRVRNEALADPLSPGSRGFSFGADFALNATSSGTSADDGDNLIQRGLYDDTGQYKIQLDGRQASCRVKGSAGDEFVKVATVTVDAGRWYRVRCTRRANTVTLAIGEIGADGSVDFTSSSKTGSIGSVALERGVPLSIGGKLKSDGALVLGATDQFNGRVDRVLYRRLG